MNKLKKLLLIRHGQTDTNIRGVMHTQNDPVGLSKEGRKQASSLIYVCKQHNVERIYTSPEKRAIQTARIITDSLDISLQISDKLHERNWGEWSGKSWFEIKEQLDKMSIEDRYTFIPPKGESWENMDERLRQFLKGIEQASEINIAVITHEGVLRAFMPLLNADSKETSFSYNFANASVSIYSYENNKYEKVSINNISHLH